MLKIATRIYERTGQRNITWFYKAPDNRNFILNRIASDSTIEQIEAGRRAALAAGSRLTSSDRGEQPTKVRIGKRDTRWLRTMYRRAKANARKRSIAFYLTPPELERLANRAGGRCELTGIPFEHEPDITRHFSPWKPSLDRVEPSGSYEFSNCRIVCCAVNIALNKFGDEVLLRIGRALVERAGID